MQCRVPFHPLAKRCLSVIAIATVASTLGASRASAQGTVLYGCYVPTSGTVYRIKATGLPDACRSQQHVQFTWSLQGPAGAQGPAGPTGPQGPAGPAGGLPQAGVTVSSETTAEPVPVGGFGSASVTCPAGKVATGGGGGVPSNSAVRFRLLRSHPTQVNGVVVRWSVEVENLGPVAAFASVQVICVPAQ